MCPEGMLLCPRLKGHKDGAFCEAANDFVRNVEDAKIRICMSRRYEVCHIYRYSLNVKVSAEADSVPKEENLNVTVTAA